jgi:hypothetical protein
MSVQPTIISPIRASDETVCHEPTGSYPIQKDEAGDTKKVPGDPEKVLSNEDEFPDGGLRAWAVVLGVGPSLSIKILH